MRPVRTLAVASGKGGVGKTNLSVNLAVSLAEFGQQVLLLDADLGLGNVDVLLGLKPEKNLSHVLSGECGLDDIVVTGPKGIRVVPASSGTQHLSQLSSAELASIVNAFGAINDPIDTLIVDTSAGVADNVLSFCRAVHDVVVVACDEPTSLADSLRAWSRYWSMSATSIGFIPSPVWCRVKGRARIRFARSTPLRGSFRRRAQVLGRGSRGPIPTKGSAG